MEVDFSLNMTFNPFSLRFPLHLDFPMADSFSDTHAVYRVAATLAKAANPAIHSSTFL